jgi:hypothetical protein
VRWQQAVEVAAVAAVRAVQAVVRAQEGVQELEAVLEQVGVREQVAALVAARPRLEQVPSAVPVALRLQAESAALRPG